MKLRANTNIAGSVTSTAAVLTVNVPLPGASLTPATREAGAGRVVYQIFVDANADWPATANAAWLAVSRTSRTKEGNVEITVQPNATGADRTGTVTIAGLTHTVTQRAAGVARREWWAVGYNDAGQLGDASTTDRSTPVQVATGVAAIAAGSYHSLYVKTDGTLWAMGSNGNGQLGDGTTTERTTPVQAGSGVSAIAACGYHSLFLKADGTVWAAGFNANGQLGDGTTTDRSTPVQAGSGVSAATAGYYHSLFVKTDGLLWAMGRNSNGQLGDGTTSDRLTPILLAANVTAASAGGYFSTFVVAGDPTVTAPTISIPPVSQTALGGSSVIFSVTAAGTPPLSYQWYHDGMAVPGATNATLALGNVSWTEAGTYTARVTNGVNWVVSNAAVLSGIPPGPAITTQPQSVTVTAGQSATISVAATGTGPLFFQWQRNGFNIAGATNASYTIGATGRADADFYGVVVADGLSFAPSQMVRLAVAPTSYPTAVAPDPAWTPQVEYRGWAVYATLPLADGRFYVAGNFTSVNGTRTPMIYRVKADGSLDPAFLAPEIDNNIRALALQSDGKLIIGGDFVRVDGEARNRLARLNPDGTVDRTFNPGTGAGGSVFALALQPADGKILVGGSFGSFNGLTANNLVRLDPNGAVDGSFRTLGFSNWIYALAVQGDGRILAGGAFTNGYYDATGAITPRTKLARLNADGTLDPGLAPTLDNTVMALALQSDGSLLIGGDFTTCNGVATGRLARLSGGP